MREAHVGHHSTWLDAFRSAFDGMAADLPVVLNARGCREGWIQAELFRRLSPSDPAFSVNFYSLNKGKTADLYGEIPSRMLAELKVLGTEGFYNKNLAGCSNLSLFLPAKEGDRVDLCADHLAVVVDAVDSLLRDFGRLKSASESFERYLILVLQTTVGQTGLARRSVPFGSRPTRPRSIIREYGCASGESVETN